MPVTLLAAWPYVTMAWPYVTRITRKCAHIPTHTHTQRSIHPRGIYTRLKTYMCYRGDGAKQALHHGEMHLGANCKVSTPVYLLYRVTQASTFENVHVIMS